jgi:hypothetical protein
MNAVKGFAGVQIRKTVLIKGQNSLLRYTEVKYGSYYQKYFFMQSFPVTMSRRRPLIILYVNAHCPDYIENELI